MILIHLYLRKLFDIVPVQYKSDNLKLKSILVFSLSIFLIDSCHEPTKPLTKTFKYNQSTGITSLDPAFSNELATMWACSHIYESLFNLDSAANLSPLLIENYTISSDGLVYSFKLKEKVYFQNDICFGKDSIGREMNAYDVMYSLSRLINPHTASPGAWVLKNKLDTIQPFRIIDSFQISIQLRKPNAQFLQVLSMPYCSIVPKEAVEYYKKDFRKHPVGTGPFRFKLWDDGTVLFFEKNRQYHLKDERGNALPYLDFVKITFNEQKKTELLSLEKNDLSFITGLDQSQIQELFDENGQIKDKWNSKVNILLKPFLNTEYIAILSRDNMLSKTSPLRHKLFRKALNYGINRKEIVQYLKKNLVIPAEKGFVPIGMPNYDNNFTGYSYQPALAMKYMREAGYTSQHKPKIELHINNNFVEMAELIAYQLKKIGVEVEIKLHPADMMMQLAVDGKLELFRRSWFADYPDAENYLACFYSKNTCPPNYTRFEDTSYDKLYEEITTEINPAKRRQRYKEMERILIEASPLIPIFYDQSLRVVHKNIKGLEQNVLNTLDLRRVQIIDSN